MEFLKKNRKYVFQAGFLLLLMGLTCYALFKDQELDQIWAIIQMANKWYILFGILLVLLFVCSESVIIYYMMHSLNRPVPLGHCIRYSFIGFFFSCITPSASGGQPAQIYYMSKDKIEVPVSTLVLMIVTITYKFVLVLTGGVLLLFGSPLIRMYMQDTGFWLYLGIVLNVGCVTLMYILIFKPRMTKRLMHLGLILLERCRFMKHKEERTRKLSKSMDKYKESAYYFRDHKLVVWNVLLLSIFQRFCLFSATYLVYKAFGLQGHSPFVIVILQAAISIAVDMLPLPGGLGISEALFLSIFKPVFGSVLVMPALLLSRGISYYALLLISALVTVIAHICVVRAEMERK